MWILKFGHRLYWDYRTGNWILFQFFRTFFLKIIGSLKKLFSFETYLENLETLSKGSNLLLQREDNGDGVALLALFQEEAVHQGCLQKKQPTLWNALHDRKNGKQNFYDKKILKISRPLFFTFEMVIAAFWWRKLTNLAVVSFEILFVGNFFYI